MRGPYGFDINDNLSEMQELPFLSQLSPTALKDLDALKFTSAYPKDALLFMENQAPRGIYVLCEGQVKLTVSSNEGKTIILRIAKAGDVLGLMAALSGKSYEMTALALRPCKVAFVRREHFLRFLAQHPEAYQAVIAQLGSHYQIACEQIRTLGLSASVTEKIAKVLLDWSADAPESKGSVRTKLPLTHEELAEFVGTTRESVTRALGELKMKQLVILQGSTLTIPSRAALKSCVAA